MNAYTEGFNDGVMAGKYGAFAADPTLDRLREMFGIQATDPDAVFAAIEAYDRRNLRIIYELEAERDHALHALGLAGGLLHQAYTAHESPQGWVERLLKDAAEEREAE